MKITTGRAMLALGITLCLITVSVLVMMLVTACCPPPPDEWSDQPETDTVLLKTVEWETSDGLRVTAFMFESQGVLGGAKYRFLRFIDEEAGIVCWSYADTDSAPSCIPISETLLSGE